LPDHVETLDDAGSGSHFGWTGNWQAGLPRPSRPLSRPACGVLIIVGGPQYRVGSHRQFLLLSRRLASEGYPVMRFDYRGMGDASGAMRSFEEVDRPTSARPSKPSRANCAVAAQDRSLGALRCRVGGAPVCRCANHDPRVAGLVLLNPWVRSEASLAQTQIKHYYGQRLLQGEFWRKLLKRPDGSPEIRSRPAADGDAWRAGRATRPAIKLTAVVSRIAWRHGWREFSGKVLLILSGRTIRPRSFSSMSAPTGLVGSARRPPRCIGSTLPMPTIPSRPACCARRWRMRPCRGWQALGGGQQ
jgi:pimeloyl-ACP methyl ester carboxylesterase